MSETLLLIVKYGSTFIALGVAFAGSWFFEFTSTDRETGKRRLTFWGKRAIIFASISLGCSIVSTIGSDLQSRSSTRDADIRADQAAKVAEREREAAEEFRTKSLTQTETIVAFIGKNFSKLPDDVKESARETISSLGGLDALKIEYPDIYEKITGAQSFGEVKIAIQEGLDARVDARISKTKECKKAKIDRSGPGFPGGSEKISQSPVRYFRYMISSDEIFFEYTDFGPAVDLADGYTLMFDDGSEPLKVDCTRWGRQSYCEADTSVQVTKTAFSRLQKSPISTIEYGGTTASVPAEVAARLRTTLSCLTP